MFLGLHISSGHYKWIMLFLAIFLHVFGIAEIASGRHPKLRDGQEQSQNMAWSSDYCIVLDV